MCNKTSVKAILGTSKEFGDFIYYSRRYRINFNETLKKLKDIYGIDTLVLTGGAIINDKH